MQIPPDQNTRAEAMWRIISQRVNFRGKRVVDLGCGTGDFLWRAYIAGADIIDGIDVENRITLELINDNEVPYHNIFFYLGDIEEIVRKPSKNFNIQLGDIALCFSVLPYLDDVPATLKWMSTNFSLCLIECQYAGDGPGLKNIGGDKGMLQYLLSNGFDSVEAIGKTYVKDRKFSSGERVYRTIWLCETKEKI